MNWPDPDMAHVVATPRSSLDRHDMACIMPRIMSLRTYGITYPRILNIHPSVRPTLHGLSALPFALPR